jgi:putative tryptophan/tyrosine transport system substrate-binding protein
MPSMRRREFVSLFGGTVAWPLAARAQQLDPVRRIGVLFGPEDDPQVKAQLAAFRYGLDRLGWSDGRNVQIDYRFASATKDTTQVLASELIAPQPDVIFVDSTRYTAAVQRQTRTIPIVFNGVADPIGAGFIASLARPGGNLTGLMLYEASVAGKWLAMLKQIAPRLARVALVYSPGNILHLRAAEASTHSLALEPVPSPVENAADIEHAIGSFAGLSNGGLMLTPDLTTFVHRDLIIALATRYRLPAVYPRREWVIDGGLMSYGTDRVDTYRQAASYVDRILRGAKPADLPVQAPVKYEMLINLKTAKALGLTVPQGLLVAADEVIE